MSQSSTDEGGALVIEADAEALARLKVFRNEFKDNVTLIERKDLSGAEILALTLIIAKYTPKLLHSTADLIRALKSDGRDFTAVLPDQTQYRDPSEEAIEKLLQEIEKLAQKSEDDNDGV